MVKLKFVAFIVAFAISVALLVLSAVLFLNPDTLSIPFGDAGHYLIAGIGLFVIMFANRKRVVYEQRDDEYVIKLDNKGAYKTYRRIFAKGKVKEVEVERSFSLNHAVDATRTLIARERAAGQQVILDKTGAVIESTFDVAEMETIDAV